MTDEAKKTFVSTKTFKHISRVLDNNSHVTICGASGEGKTTMALMLGRKYMKQGYEVVFVERVDTFDLASCLHSEQNIFLIVDDIFGTVGLSTDLTHLRIFLDSLKLLLGKNERTLSKDNPISGNRHQSSTTTQKQIGKVLPKQEHFHLRNKAQKKSVKVILTSKSYNLKEGLSKLQYQRLSMFTGHTVIDLTLGHGSVYSDKEKVAMFEQHRKNNPQFDLGGISVKDLIDQDAPPFGFPFTCKLFFEFAAFRQNVVDFFKRPLFYLRIEITDILSLRNNQAAALILVTLCEEKVKLSHLEIPGKNGNLDEMLKHVIDFAPSAARSGITTAARNFRGTFFSRGDTLSFAHSSIYDACACVLYEFAPCLVLQHCSLEFLYERLRIGSTNETMVTDYRHFLLVTEEYFDLVIMRMIGGLRQGKFSKTTTHPMLKNDNFVKQLLNAFQTTEGADQPSWVLKREQGKGLMYWVALSQSSLFIHKIETTLQIAFSQNEIKEALTACVETDNLPLLQEFVIRLEMEPDILLKDTLLLLSAEHSSWKMAEYLINMGASITAINENERNYVHLLCFHAKDQVLDKLKSKKEMIKHDFQNAIEASDDKGETPVMLAASMGAWECFKLLKDSCAFNSTIKEMDNEGNYLIHLACYGGNLNIVKDCLTCENINSRDEDGGTPVMHAAIYGNQEVFDFLVSNNADLTLRDGDGTALLHYACIGGSVHIVECVLTPGNINSRGRFGITPLISAAIAGHKKVFDLLVSHNADLTLVDQGGTAVLHHACYGGNVDIVEHVLTPDNINSRGMFGFTPLMCAAREGHKKVFDLLESHNADLTLVDDNGDALLHHACYGGNVDIVEHVLTPGNINSRGFNQETPIMHAAKEGHVGVVKLLRERGADLKRKRHVKAKTK